MRTTAGWRALQCLAVERGHIGAFEVLYRDAVAVAAKESSCCRKWLLKGRLAPAVGEEDDGRKSHEEALPPLQQCKWLEHGSAGIANLNGDPEIVRFAEVVDI
jgi:hypothetical protein